jgi:hypothetical protein
VNAQEYALYDAATHRTDIDIVPPHMVDMFGSTALTTELVFTCETVDWVKRALFQYQSAFSRDMHQVQLLFINSADALGSTILLHELSNAPLTYPVTLEPAQSATSSEEVSGPVNPVDLSRQLTEWLGVTYDQLSEITGISRAAFFYWRRPGASPRGSNVQRIERLYAPISLLVKRFGVRGTRSWLHSGEDPVWDRLLAGDLAAVDEAVRTKLFRRSTPFLDRNEIPADEVSLDLPSARSGEKLGPRRAGRRPTRRRLNTE